MKKNITFLLLIITIKSLFVNCYLRKDSISPKRDYIFPRTVPSIHPYILRSNRNVEVLPTMMGPIRQDIIKLLQLGLRQSVTESNKILNIGDNCQCAKVSNNIKFIGNNM